MVREQISDISVTWEGGVTSEDLLIERTVSHWENVTLRKQMISGKRSWEPLQMKDRSTFTAVSRQIVSTSVPEETGMKIRRISLVFSLAPLMSGWRVKRW